MNALPVTLTVPVWAEAGASADADADAAHPVLVFLHGIGGGKQGFASQLAYFAQAGWRALAWDMPGYGQSAALHPVDFPALADALLRMLDAAGVQRAVLIGHSMGGMVAQQAWTLCPERIAGLVIAASSPAFGHSTGDFQKQFVAQRVAPLDAGKTMADVADALIPSMVAPAYQGAGLALARDCMSAVPSATYRASIQALVTFEQRAALPTITVPTLCLAAEHDTTAPPEVLRRMAEKIPGAVFEVLAGAGHLLCFEQPDLFNRVIEHFLKQQGLERAK
jgi:pimeloyl-ACP methyl ester carboxylesterase